MDQCSCGNSYQMENSRVLKAFNRLPRIWNKLPSIDLSLSLPTIKTIISTTIYINILLNTFHPAIHVLSTFAAGVVTVTTRDLSVIFRPYN